ncbi:putative RecB family nuclease, family [Anaerohalosphaera lusitana]|uniref:Putative RecB family nuclease, family n=1 Tax=Anaerohalosphaera lusitana TaxID=1936003 RepID=A0A1U9NQH8_9BACT|nr:ribonuclease H-like domain-containing protein [Anaerohalosphaera lusitana]AQT69870.1 putative RecB family nuclease, family [Anaerohalosphaera lusitana]
MKTRAYLDIETTGLSRSRAELTVVGIAIERPTAMGEEPLDLIQLVSPEIDEPGLYKSLESVDEIYTYNGSRFDLPFIKSSLQADLKTKFRHTDLMYHCWKRKLKGGLKSVERQLKIERNLTEVDGYQAVVLWWQYINHNDQNALKTLLEYNAEDVINLQHLRLKLSVD